MRVNVTDPVTLTSNGMGAGQPDWSGIRNAGPPRRWAAWIPDLSVSLAVLTLVWCLLIFDGWHKLFRDSDTGWHIRTGESILASRSLPSTDPYSFTRAGSRWMDWEWGADVVSGAAHRFAGLPGVVVLFAAAISACSLLWVRLTWAAGGDFLLACVLSLPMLSTVNMHWLARPHVFGWIFLLAWLIWMERSADRIRLGAVAAALASGAVWANVHGSFFLAPLIACLYAVGSVLKPALWDTERRPAWIRARWYISVAAVFLLGTALNPNGFALHGHIARYLGDSELLARVGEFQSFNFHADGAVWILVTVLFSIAGGVLAIGNRRPEHALLIFFLVAIALRSARGLPILALSVLPLANANIAGALERARGLRPRIRFRLDRFLNYSQRLRSIDRGLSGVALLPLFLIVLAIIATVPGVAKMTGFPPDQFPVEAAAAVSALPDSARILAPDKYGGYLIYRFEGRRKVFFDGRSDFYGSQYMKDYLRLMEARPGWRAIADRFAFTHVLLPTDSPLAAALNASGWSVIHKDGTAALLARPE